jgi:hypothetical protein
MLVRGEHRDVVIREVVTRPEFLRARVTRSERDGEKFTQYKIEIEIPRDASPGDFRGPRRGQVMLKTNHPAHPEIPIHVDFAIAPPG